jgi:hypothetical protein
MTVTEQELPKIKQRVQNGVRWLDKNYPGWRDEIQVDHLKITDCYNCIAGQLTGGQTCYSLFRKHNFTQHEQAHFGFFHPIELDESQDSLEPYYYELQLAWQNELRRTAPKTETSGAPAAELPASTLAPAR